MQKKATPKKLTLTRETLWSLSGSDLREVAAGYNYSTGVICHHSNGQVTNCSICPGCTI